MNTKINIQDLIVDCGNEVKSKFIKIRGVLGLCTTMKKQQYTSMTQTVFLYYQTKFIPILKKYIYRPKYICNVLLNHQKNIYICREYLVSENNIYNIITVDLGLHIYRAYIVFLSEPSLLFALSLSLSLSPSCSVSFIIIIFSIPNKQK